MMSAHERGAIAPQFLIVLFFVSALALGTGAFVTATFNAEKRAIERDTTRIEFSEILETMLTDIRNDPTPETDSADDAVWDWNGKETNGYTVSLRSLSSSLNPNFVRKNILEGTALNGLFKAGKTPDELQQYREDSGLFLSDAGYELFFEKDTLDKYFSGYGWGNINLIDEFAVRTLALSVTGSEWTANQMREKVRNLLLKGEIIGREALPSLLDLSYTTLFPFINTEPTMNVNFVEPLILHEILSFPDYTLDSPSDKAHTLLALREMRGVNQSDIENTLGIDKTNRLYYFFGSITWFLEIRIQGEKERCVAIVCRYPSEDAGLTTPPLFRIIETRFEK